MRFDEDGNPREIFSPVSLLFVSRDTESFTPPLAQFAGELPAGLFGEPVHIVGHVWAVPLAGAHQAETVLEMLRDKGLGEQWRVEPSFVDTRYTAESKAVGHGLAFVEVKLAKEQEPKPDFGPLPANQRPAVVALLDQGVQQQNWLDASGAYLIDAEQQGWAPDVLAGDRTSTGGLVPVVDMKGHGTFIAGIIRQVAPKAEVLSVRVMNEDGKANEATVCKALEWVLHHVQDGNPVDVLCMAFGRLPGDHTDQPLIHEMEDLLGKLAREGVQLVASAGNDHDDELIYPAGFGVVTAVGAGFGGYHAEFSNFGKWVDRYCDGVDVLSVLPGTDRWAKWNGTSFAAANYAATLAVPRVVRPHAAG